MQEINDERCKGWLGIDGWTDRQSHTPHHTTPQSDRDRDRQTDRQTDRRKGKRGAQLAFAAT